MFTFIGDAGFDDYLISKETLLGGCALNVATHFSRNSNLTPTLIYPAGKDNLYIEEHCQREGVNSIPLKREGLCPVQDIEVQNDGEKNFTNYHPGILKDFILKEKNIFKELEGYIVCPLFVQILPFIDQIIKLSPKAKFIFDFHNAADIPIEKYLKYAYLAQFGLGEDLGLEQYLVEYVKSNETNILITRGSGKVSYYTKNHITEYRPKVLKEIVDSTGAGDSFLGAFLANIDKDNRLEIASTYASKIIMKEGAF